MLDLPHNWEALEQARKSYLKKSFQTIERS